MSHYSEALLGFYAAWVGCWLPMLWDSHLQGLNSPWNFACVVSVSSDILWLYYCWNLEFYQS